MTFRQLPFESSVQGCGRRGSERLALECAFLVLMQTKHFAKVYVIAPVPLAALYTAVR